jgi:hypothetical protein
MTAMRRIALLATLFVLAPAGVAQAGGWATVELGAPPAGLAAGTPWHVTLIVKQHGITPMKGVHPSVMIQNESGVSKTFKAAPTERVGVYAADVTFPSGGTWSARLYDGFTDVVPHRISELNVGTGAAAGGGFPVPQAVMIAIVALLFIGGWIATVPRRERRVARGRGRTAPRAVA